MKKSFAITIAIIFLCPFVNINAQQVNTEWVINNFTGFPVGVMIGLDNNENVFVAGQSGDQTKIIITKYDTNGNLIWERFYSIQDLGVVATWLSVDPSGNIIVTGYPRTFSSNPVFSKEQLEQLVAPIALYSDSLLMQILMASTYPIEVVEAERFVTAHPGLTGTKLDETLKGEDWDASVKGLCTVPEVLKKMSANLDWTQDLGDAFLGQKDQLLDTVQVMRGKANDAGNLKTTEQQVVTVKEEKIIVIESPSPEVVYVPTYSPTVVYGGWYYPSYYYPPMYPYIEIVAKVNPRSRQFSMIAGR